MASRSKRSVCRSPLSSDDDIKSPVKATVKRRPSRRVKVAPRKAARKLQQLHSVHTDRESDDWSPDLDAEIESAPANFTAYLASQLNYSVQTTALERFGDSHGSVVQAPSSSNIDTDQFGRWMQRLGFDWKFIFGTSVYCTTLNRCSHLRTLLSKASGGTNSISQPLSEDTISSSQQSEIEKIKDQLARLDHEKLEFVSQSEHHRLLSSKSHAQVADAMEEVLAKPSRRKDKTRARRLSRMDRLSRLTLSPSLAQTTGATIKDDELNWTSDVVRRQSISRQLWDTTNQDNISDEAISLVFSSGYVGLQQLLTCVRDVSKRWRKLSLPAQAWAVADYQTRENHVDIEEVCDRYPRGNYLSDGAYKQIFKVYSSANDHVDAVSLMDIHAIEGTGNERVIRQEVAHSVLLSELVSSGFCPNFVHIYDVFVSAGRPDAESWGSPTDRKPVELLPQRKHSSVHFRPVGSDMDKLYQYIHMEFCDGGDMEDFISLQPEQVLPVSDAVVPFFFQMVFGLYCAREHFGLRHCDVKLLNFFLKDIDRSGFTCTKDQVDIAYDLGDTRYVLTLPSKYAYWVKIADYGTAESNAETLGKRVTMDQFTTLENTPIEYLFEGDCAIQSFASDTFSLGLCFFHLLTGSSPYEEILSQVKCPSALLKDLRKLWTDLQTSTFTVIKSVAEDDADDLLYHTLYRFLVLLGLPDTNAGQVPDVYDLLQRHLCPPSGHRSSRVQRQYDMDRKQFSLASGRHPLLQRCRARMRQLPGAKDLLLQMLSFDPMERPSLKRILQDDIFSSLLSSKSHDVLIASYSDHFPNV